MLPFWSLSAVFVTDSGNVDDLGFESNIAEDLGGRGVLDPSGIDTALRVRTLEDKSALTAEISCSESDVGLLRIEINDFSSSDVRQVDDILSAIE